MEKSIASYLFRNGSCILPGIGKLSVVTNPAETSFINAYIKAPVQTVKFSSQDKNEATFNELSAESGHLKMLLDSKGTVTLNGIGRFYKDDEGRLHFEAQEANKLLTPSIKVERVVHQDAKHAMLVGDKETDNVIMTEYFSEAPKKKNTWWIAAIIATAITLAILVLHFVQKNPDNLFSGNTINIQAASEEPTYRSVK